MLHRSMTNANLRKTAVVLIAGVLSLWAAVPQTGGYAGLLNGVKSWVTLNAPSGTPADQCWHGVGSAPDGDIYITAEDHATNSMLYRLYQKDDTLRYVGDARAASQAANNWQTGETCQKFHDRPVFLNGKVYVASLDRSTLDNAYLSSRGFHWYCYDTAQNTFTDLSASEPNGVGSPHLQLICIQPDPRKNVIYGNTIPEVKEVSYDVANKVTTVLGRPSQWTTPQYLYSDRVQWVDSRSRLYITAGNDRAQWNMGEPVSTFNHVWYYDPASGFGELTNFPLQGANAIECGGWNRERTKWYGSDDHGHLYCFTDSGPTWTYLGTTSINPVQKVWTLEVSPDGDKLYVGRCDNENGLNEPRAVFEFDIAAKTSRQVFTISECDATAGSRAFLTGYDSWDQAGNFYLSEFSMNDGNNVIMTRFNPVKLKVAKGLLPELVEVTAAAGTGGAVVVTRTGATTGALKVIYDITGMGAAGQELSKIFGSVIIPAGASSATVTVDETPLSAVAGVVNVAFTVAFDGDNYLAGAQRIVQLGGLGVRDAYAGAKAQDKNFMHTLRNSSGGIMVRLNIARTSMTRVTVYDLDGRVVRTLLNRPCSAGVYDIPMNEGTVKANAASGVLVVEAQTAEQCVRQRIASFR
jgi:hypothetical protein